MPPAGCGSRRWRSEMATTATRVAGTAAVVEARRRLADRDGFLAWAFLLPSVVYIVALVAVPFFLAIGFALSDVTAGDPSYNFVEDGPEVRQPHEVVRRVARGDVGERELPGHLPRP